jgi:cytochrome P450 family 130
MLRVMASKTEEIFTPRSGAGWRSPWGMYEHLRDESPVHHVEDGDYWVFSRYDDVLPAVRDTEVYSSASGLTVSYQEMSRSGYGEAVPMVMLDPPEHTDFRALITRGYTPRRVASIEPAVRTFVRARLDALEASGTCDIIAELFRPVPAFVVANYLGVPERDRAMFDGWAEKIVGATDPLSAPEAIGELFAYFADLIERRRADPADDTVSDLARLMADDPNGPLRILGFAFTMIAGGNDTATGLLGGSLDLLTEYRDQRRALVDDPSLIPGAIEELLRMTSPVQGLARTVTKDVHLYDRMIPAGRKVLLLYAAANRDPRAFGNDAESLDIRRHGVQHLAFAYGPHHCLGAAAARLQARIVLEELLARYPDFEVDAEAGEFATGRFVRRYASLPFTAGKRARTPSLTVV